MQWRTLGLKNKHDHFNMQWVTLQSIYMASGFLEYMVGWKKWLQSKPDHLNMQWVTLSDSKVTMNT